MTLDPWSADIKRNFSITNLETLSPRFGPSTAPQRLLKYESSEAEAATTRARRVCGLQVPESLSSAHEHVFLRSTGDGGGEEELTLSSQATSPQLLGASAVATSALVLPGLMTTVSAIWSA